MNKEAIAARLLCLSRLRSPLAGMLRWSGVLVFNYHRVGEENASPFDRGLWSASAEAFTEQIRFCKSQLEMITPDDLPRIRASTHGRYGMITFDDGYLDNYQVAFPILKAEEVPATFFITTGFIDSHRVSWWDEIAWMVRTSKHDLIELPDWLPAPVSFDNPDRERAVWTLLHAYKAMPSDSAVSYLDAIARATGSGRCERDASQALWMNWDMLREMKAAGMTIGAHTVTHPVLARASQEHQRDEILGCCNRLIEEMGQPIRHFSYPVGGQNAFDAITRDVLREAGIQHAFSYYGGFRRFSDWDDYDIRRVPVEPYIDFDWFRSIVSLPHLFA
jgi:peptidoglycan/xylan/chitin deacetylase (PgdA/CDA1 family)